MIAVQSPPLLPLLFSLLPELLLSPPSFIPPFMPHPPSLSSSLSLSTFPMSLSVPSTLPISFSPSFPSICRDKLRSCGTVERLVADVPYMSQELDRFQALLRQAGDKWGGGREMSDKVRHVDTHSWIPIVFACSPYQFHQMFAEEPVVCKKCG